MPGPTFLAGEAINLRTIGREDKNLVQKAFNTPAIRKPIGIPVPMNEEAITDYFEEVITGTESVHLVVESEDQSVGFVSFEEIDERSRVAEIGFWVLPEEQDQGFATEAISLLVQYGFNQLNLHKVSAEVYEFNTSSMHVLEKLGFSREGTHRDGVFVDGEYHDVCWYGLLRSEWSSGTGDHFE